MAKRAALPGWPTTRGPTRHAEANAEKLREAAAHWKAQYATVKEQLDSVLVAASAAAAAAAELDAAKVRIAALEAEAAEASATRDGLTERLAAAEAASATLQEEVDAQAAAASEAARTAKAAEAALVATRAEVAAAEAKAGAAGGAGLGEGGAGLSGASDGSADASALRRPQPAPEGQSAPAQLSHRSPLIGAEYTLASLTLGPQGSPVSMDTMYLMSNALLLCATPAPPAWLWVCISKTPLNHEQSMLPPLLRVNTRDRVRAIATLSRKPSGSDGAILHVSILAPAACAIHESRHFALLLTLIHAHPNSMPMYRLHSLLLDSLGRTAKDGEVWSSAHLERRQRQLAGVLAGEEETGSEGQLCVCQQEPTETKSSVRAQKGGSQDCAFAVAYMLRWLLAASVRADASAASVFAAAHTDLHGGAEEYSTERTWWQEQVRSAKRTVGEWAAPARLHQSSQQQQHRSCKRTRKQPQRMDSSSSGGCDYAGRSKANAQVVE